jgi:hypothetical protein
MAKDSHHEQTKPKQARIRSKGLWTSGSLAMLLGATFAGGWLLSVDAAKKGLVEATALADAEDPNWRMADLDVHGRRRVPDAENGALVLLEADRLLPAGWPSWPVSKLGEDVAVASQKRQQFISDLNELAPCLQLNERQTAALRAELARANAALQEARKLVRFATGRYPVKWSPDYFSTALPHEPKLQSVAALLGYDALLAAQDGNADQSLASCLAALNAGRTIGDEQSFSTQLSRIACQSIAVRKSERALAQGQPSPAALAALQTALDEEAEAPLLYYGVRGMRAGLDGFMELVEKHQVPLGKLQALVRTTTVSATSPGELSDLAMLTTFTKSQRAAWLRFTTEWVTAAKLPPDEQRERLKELERNLPNHSFMIQHLGPALSNAATMCACARAELRCAVTALALERYRLDKHAWPASLGELVPAYAAQVPTDPFDGQPLRFRAFHGALVIYSIGPDGIDNHGHITANPRAGGTDIGFRLWDIPHRRRPPN